MADLEIYVETADAQLEAWLSSRVGRLSRKHEDNATVIYRSDQGTAVTVTRGIEGSRFTSIYVVGDTLPWSTHAAFARDAARSLLTVVRSVPETPRRDEYLLEVSPTGEKLIVWDEQS